MDQAQPTLAWRRIFRAAKRSVTRTLQLLWCARQLALAVPLLCVGDKLRLQVAQPSELAAKLHVGAVWASDRVCFARPAVYHRDTATESVCLMARSCAEASRTEEPGAEKLHAGVCTGGAG
jgi:hypothetical protein